MQEIANAFGWKRKPKVEERSKSLEGTGGKYFDEAVKKVPKKYRDWAERLRPVVLAVLRALDALVPYLPLLWVWCKRAYAAALPYWDEMGVFWGVMLTFFGGSFMMTITTIEAFRLVGRDKMVAAWRKIEDDVLLLIQEFKAKNEGSTLEPEEWVRQNLSLVLSTIDPDDCRDACIGFYAGATAVIACLRTQFAKVVALGVSCGEVLEEHIGRQHVAPIVKALLMDEKHWKWEPFLTQIVCRIPVVIVAYALQRIIVAFHSAIRGASILSKALLNFCYKRSILKEEPSPQLRAAVASSFVTAGLMFQLSSGFDLPWLLSLPLFPFVVVESILSLITLGI